MTPLLALAALSLGPAAPIPKAPPPSPLGHPYVGVRLTSSRTTNPKMAIDAPVPGTPSHKAGLQAGDELVRIGECTPKNFDEFCDYVLDFRPGTVLELEVKRRGESKTFKVTLGTRPEDYGEPDFSRKSPYLKLFGGQFRD